jgi:hypothetical protein
VKYQKHHDHWTVLYANGSKSYWKTEEGAKAEAYLHGIGIRGPLYRVE